jgi:Asp-tRNA(Asn)/Glu-tRNA(Gln) amidotransferase B subunit
MTINAKRKHSPGWRNVSLRASAVEMIKKIVEREQSTAIPRWNSVADFVHEAIKEKSAAVEAMHLRVKSGAQVLEGNGI